MKAVSIDAVSDWIALHMQTGRAEARLTSEASPGASADDIDAHALFWAAVDRLSQTFGEPDVRDWPISVVTATFAPMAMWDFDYYQLELRFEGRDSRAGEVILTVHRERLPVEGRRDE